MLKSHTVLLKGLIKTKKNKIKYSFSGRAARDTRRKMPWPTHHVAIHGYGDIGDADLYSDLQVISSTTCMTSRWWQVSPGVDGWTQMFTDVSVSEIGHERDKTTHLQIFQKTIILYHTFITIYKIYIFLIFSFRPSPIPPFSLFLFSLPLNIPSLPLFPSPYFLPLYVSPLPPEPRTREELGARTHLPGPLLVSSWLLAKSPLLAIAGKKG